MGSEGDPFAHLAVGMALFEGGLARGARADGGGSQGRHPGGRRSRLREARHRAMQLALASVVGFALALAFGLRG